MLLITLLSAAVVAQGNLDLHLHEDAFCHTNRMPFLGGVLLLPIIKQLT